MNLQSSCLSLPSLGLQACANTPSLDSSFFFILYFETGSHEVVEGLAEESERDRERERES